MKIYKTVSVSKGESNVTLTNCKACGSAILSQGLLGRASEATQIASFELFIDLLFVGVLAINWDHVGEAPDATKVHRFVKTSIMCESFGIS